MKIPSYNDKRTVKFKYEKAILSLLIFVIFLFISTFSYFYFFVLPDRISIETVTDSSLKIPDCSNMSLQDTAICLNEFVINHFKYKDTPDYLVLTDSQLFTLGGDCKNYVSFYKKYMEFYGFKTKIDELYVEEEKIENKTVDLYHTFLITYNYQGYCILDMEFLDCVGYVDEDGEVKP